MRLRFKQRFFSWFDSYDIYNEEGAYVNTVKAQIAVQHGFGNGMEEKLRLSVQSHIAIVLWTPHTWLCRN